MRTNLVVRLGVAGLVAWIGSVALTAGQGVAVKIEPRDQLKISVWNAGVAEEAYSVSVIVDVDGSFEYPTVGRVKAVGLTARELEASLKATLDKYLVSPQVTVDLSQTENKKLFISGQVRIPGPIQFGGEMTLFEALTRAGSVTEDAADEVVVHRGGQSIRVDVYELLNGESMNSNIVLREGDMITVPKSEPVIVSGFVQAQGPVHVKRNTTVRQVIAMAGGLATRGSDKGIKIQRMVDGKKKEIQVKNFDTDVVKPGDTVIVGARRF